MKNLDRQTVELRLARMRTCLERVRAIRSRGIDSLVESRDAQTMLKRDLQVALQACIDLGGDILLACNGDVPASYAEAFDQLGARGIVDPALCRRLHRVAELRNRLVFHYLDDDDPKALFESLSVVQELDSFSEAVGALMREPHDSPGEEC